MSIDILRKNLKDKTEALATLNTKAAAEAATVEDVAALVAATAEVKALQDRIDALVEAEQVAAKSAKPVKTPATLPAQAKQHPRDDSAQFTVGVIMAGAAMVKGGHANSIREALDENGFGAIADRFENLSGKQLSSSINSGGLLVPPTMAAEIIEFLRPSTAFLQNSPRRVPLTNGSYYQAAGATGATAAYGRENSVPAYSEATFRDVNLFAKELQGKTSISNLLLRRGVSAIRQFVDDDLRSAMAETMDLNMFLGDGLQARPLGIYNIPGIRSRAATNTTTPTVAQVEADVRWAINSITTANINLAGVRWTMSQETAGFLEDMRDGNGNFLFPTMQDANPTWKRMPVSVTTNLPTNLGAGSNRTFLSLAAYPHVFFGEEDGITIRVTTEGSITDGAGNQRSAFERDETHMITVARHDVGLRHLRAVALLTDLNWGR